MYLIVDGSSLLYASLYSILQVKETYNGRYTAGLSEFLERLKSLVATLHINYPINNCIVVWDGDEYSSRRLAIYPAYKESPNDKTDEIKKKFLETRDYLDKTLPYLGVRHIRFADKEADDVIALITRRVEDSIIASKDLDFCTLLSESVSLCSFSAGKPVMTYKDYGSITGLKKMCVGDPSDNIKGIQSIGEKKFETLARGFTGSSVEDFIMHVITTCNDAPLKEKFLQGVPIFLRNYQLIDLALEEFSELHNKELDEVLTKDAEVSVNHVKKIGEKGGITKLTHTASIWVAPFLVLQERRNSGDVENT